MQKTIFSTTTSYQGVMAKDVLQFSFTLIFKHKYFYMQPLTKILLASILSLLLFSCNTPVETPKPDSTNIEADKAQIAAMLDSFNTAAARSDYDSYFSFYTNDATFIGTDATENWDKTAFMVWAKPYFDKKSTWNFTALERNIFFGDHADIAWFDELLNTQMKICRGSGVVVKREGKWMVQQYVLSTTIPNSLIDTVVSIKATEEDAIINKLKDK